ncbi:MAG: hypothetical protein H6937_03725 [Burkholderiales bacterium]|nr:hypothetical protein [Burkholderiales bacterium]MDR4518667.1 hypothetical protein [Nitrosomonas sp.]
MTNTYQDYFDTLGFRESSSIPGGAQNYHTENPFGFIGKYQFGEAALFDLGYYGIDGSDSNLFRNDWSGNWSGKNGINSKQDFFNNGTVQEIIVREWHETLWNRITFLELDKYDGQILNGQPITISGMLSAAHLIGAGSSTSETAGLKGYLLSGAVFNPEDNNGTTANEYMAVFSGFQTPFATNHSTAETIDGGIGKDILTGFGGNDFLNGNTSIDTAIYTSQSSEYVLVKHTAETWTVSHQNDGADGTDTLIDIERIAFSDTSLALDLEDNAGITAKLLGAVFGHESVSNKQFVGIGLRFLDNGTHYEALMQLAIDAALGVDATNHTAVVDLLYENIIGFTPSPAAEAQFVRLLDSGTYTVAELGVLAAETTLNQENIDLVGLSQTGLEFL